MARSRSAIWSVREQDAGCGGGGEAGAVSNLVIEDGLLLHLGLCRGRLPSLQTHQRAQSMV